MQIKPSDETKLTKLWNGCLLDRDIAERLGYKSRDISNYRRDHNMPSNAGLMREGVQKCQETEQRKAN
jgi:hypothetical protein